MKKEYFAPALTDIRLNCTSFLMISGGGKGNEGDDADSKRFGALSKMTTRRKNPSSKPIILQSFYSLFSPPPLWGSGERVLL